MFESALSRAQQRSAFGAPAPDVAALAANYAWGIARNHPFVDGNQRTAFVAVELSLLLTGYELAAEDTDCVLTMPAAAAGKLKDVELAAWVRSHAVPRS